MGRRYYVDLPPTAVAVAADLLELTPADDKPIRILALNIGQTTDVGDAQEEIISLVWIRGFTASGSGGSTSTPRPCVPSDAAAGFTAEIFNTSAATTGTSVNLARHAWNVRVGIERPYTPDEAMEATQANTTILLRMGAAPVDSITISGSVLVEEYG